MLNMSCSDQCFGLEKQFNAAMYKHLHLEAKKRPWLIRMSAFPIALTTSLISLATRIVAIAESVFKGLGNMFGFIFSKNCSFVTGLKQILFEVPKNVILTPVTLVASTHGLFAGTLGMLRDPVGYTGNRLYNQNEKAQTKDNGKDKSQESHEKPDITVDKPSQDNKNQHIPTLQSHVDTPEDMAAITVQKYIRGYLAQRPLLPGNLFPQYHIQCEKAKYPESSSMPRADGGRTRVYLPKEMPEVVLKSSGRTDAIKRFHQMQYVRSILDSQNSSHLVIPKASLCGDFLVEQRLPINVDSYHNMGLYLSHPQLFDDAVREMTRLFSKVYLSDLVVPQHNPLGHIANVGDFVRYDNLPLYIEDNKGKKVGKIGLIDLEHMQEGSESNSLKILARIFPHHLDIIKEEAKNLNMQVNNRFLDDAAAKGKKYLQIGFSDHLEWLKNRGISTKASTQSIEIGSERIIELTNLVENELVKLNQGENDLFVRKEYSDKPQKNFFIEDPVVVARELAEKITPMIIDNIKAQIKKMQEEKLRKIGEQHISDSELVSLRSPVMKRPELHKGVGQLIVESPKIKLKNALQFEHNDIAEQIAYVIIQELVKGGELFFFDPAYYTVGHNLCWLRY